MLSACLRRDVDDDDVHKITYYYVSYRAVWYVFGIVRVRHIP